MMSFLILIVLPNTDFSGNRVLF